MLFREIELKLADMEDRSRRCNIHVIGLKDGLEGSNAIQYLTRSLPEWFPTFAEVYIEIMRAHRFYSDDKWGANHILIFNVPRYRTRQGQKVSFFPCYSNVTVKRRQAFYQAMDTARDKCLDFILLYPATWKIKEGTLYRSFTLPKDAEDYVNSTTAKLVAPAGGHQHLGFPPKQDSGGSL